MTKRVKKKIGYQIKLCYNYSHTNVTDPQDVIEVTSKIYHFYEYQIHVCPMGRRGRMTTILYLTARNKTKQGRR